MSTDHPSILMPLAQICPHCGSPERWHDPNAGLYGCPDCTHVAIEPEH
mgnify:CR=1 FL=1